MLKHIIYPGLVALSLGLAPLAARAQDDPDDGGPTPVTQPNQVPLDGGASLLLAGGVAYGLRRLRQRRAK